MALPASCPLPHSPTPWDLLSLLQSSVRFVSSSVFHLPRSPMSCFMRLSVKTTADICPGSLWVWQCQAPVSHDMLSRSIIWSLLHVTWGLRRLVASLPVHLLYLSPPPPPPHPPAGHGYNGTKIFSPGICVVLAVIPPSSRVIIFIGDGGITGTVPEGNWWDLLDKTFNFHMFGGAPRGTLHW